MSSKLTGVPRCPDISTCSAEYCGIGDLFYCLTEARSLCDFPLNFGGRFFCRHPHNADIAAKTRAMAAPADGAP